MHDQHDAEAAGRALLPRTWFAKDITLDYVRRALEAGTRTIRIACGFFTLRGWGLIRRSTAGKQVLILVGIDDPGEEALVPLAFAISCAISLPVWTGIAVWPSRTLEQGYGPA